MFATRRGKMEKGGGENENSSTKWGGGLMGKCGRCRL